MDINELKKLAMLAQSTQWQEIKNIMFSKIVQASTSNIDPVELKGLLKFIADVDSWIDDYERKLKKKRDENYDR